MITISELKDILVSKAGGKPLSKVSNFYALCYQAMYRLKGKVDLPSSLKSAELYNPIYTGVNRYILPQDVALGKIIGVRPIIEKNTDIYFNDRISGGQFNNELKYNYLDRYTVLNKDGEQSILINKEISQPLVIHNCDDNTSNGTFTTLTGAENLEINTLKVKSGDGSISFDLTASDGGIENALLNSINISDYKDLLFYIDIPDVTNLDSVTFKIGNNSLQHKYSVVTKNFDNKSIQKGENLIKIRIKNLIEFNNLLLTDLTNIRYISISLQMKPTFTSPIKEIIVDNIVAVTGALYKIDYYSIYQFKDVNGIWKKMPTIDSDYLMLTEDEIDLYTDFLTSLISIDIKQTGSANDISFYGGNELLLKISDFRRKNPSMIQHMRSTYGSKLEAKD